MPAGAFSYLRNTKLTSQDDVSKKQSQKRQKRPPRTLGFEVIDREGLHKSNNPTLSELIPFGYHLEVFLRAILARVATAVVFGDPVNF